MNGLTINGDYSITTKSCRFVLRLVIILLISALLFACGTNENPTQENNSAGIAFRLKWPVAKSVGSAPAGVVTVRMSVSGPGMSTMSQDFAASAGTGSIAGVPVGSGRTIIFQGLDSSPVPSIKYEAVVYNKTLVAGQTLDCGQVTMKNTVPGAPTGLVATAVSSSQIDLVWEDKADNEIGYRIERKTGPGGTFGPIATTAANASSYSDTSLSSATSYSYQVVAINGMGDSFYSNESSGITPEITYSISGTVTSGGLPLTGVTVTLTGDVLTTMTTDSSGNYSFSGARTGSYILTPGSAGYTFNPVSLPVTVTNANLALMNFSATASTAPNAPSGLGATPVSASRINLVWTDNANNETGYLIERKSGAGGSYAQIATAAANAATYIDFSPAASTEYTYRVRATNGSGNSGYSNEINAATFAAATPITPELVRVSGGTFAMGGTTQLSVGDFYIGKYEVTQREWSAVMVNNPSKFSTYGLDYPVESVSWNDVQAFITVLNGLSGKIYRLPTEAEWEYAARSGGLDQLYSGGSDVDAVAWYASNSGRSTQRVGLKQANGLGIFDMSGNVAEWVSDLSGSTNRVLRGGSWVGTAAYQLTTARSSFVPGTKSEHLGFRLAITTP